MIVLGAVFLFKIWAARDEARLLPSLAPSEMPEPPVTKKESMREGSRPSLKSIDVNNATMEELEALPGVGPKLAGMIVLDRLQRGPFHNAKDLLRVKGVGPKNLARMEPYLQFESTQP